MRRPFLRLVQNRALHRVQTLAPPRRNEPSVDPIIHNILGIRVSTRVVANISSGVVVARVINHLLEFSIEVAAGVAHLQRVPAPTDRPTR